MAGIRLVALMRVQPGSADRFVEAWRGHLDEVRGEPGCIQYEIFRSASDPDQLVMLEHWESREAFDAHWDRERNQPGGPGVAEANGLFAPPVGDEPPGPEMYAYTKYYIDGDVFRPFVT
jgi:quinol monooxygenase YgiN